MSAVTTKTCRRGHVYTPGIPRGCRVCYKIYHARYYRQNKEKWHQQKVRSRRKNPEVHRRYELERRRDRYELVLIVSARRRAKKIGVPFDLKADDLRPLPTTCPILGVVLKTNNGKGGVPGPNSPSLDRLVPERGYVKGNVRIISYRANALKNNATPEELRLIADWIENERKDIDWLFK